MFTVTRPTLIFASDPMNFYTEFGQPFLLFNQQQCFIYSTASFLSKLRAKKIGKLHNSSFCRKFRKWNIGFRNRERIFPVLPIIKKRTKNLSRLTNPRFFWHVTVNIHIIFFGLSRFCIIFGLFFLVCPNRFCIIFGLWIKNVCCFGLKQIWHLV